MSKAEDYYYNLLDKTGKQAYHAIKAGLLALSSNISVPLMDGRSITDIYFLIRLDHPEIFYTTSFRCRFYPGAETMELMPDYLYTKKQIKAHQQAMQSRIQKLIRPAVKLSDKEKELYVHDFICTNVTYDKLKKAYSHEIIGPLGHGIGVCEGIAKTVKILLDALGVWCIIPICDNNPDKNIKYRHTWNMVKLGGEHYHLDATFDNSLGKQEMIRYDYFNLDDTSFFRDHEPVIWKVPACKDGKSRYYIEKKMTFTTLEEVRKRCAQHVKKGKVFLFHWRGGYLTREVLKELLTIFAEEASKKEKHASLSLNWPQAVLKVTFRDEVAETYIMEQANEGELS